VNRIRLKFGFRRIGSGTTPERSNPEYFGGDTPWLTSSEIRDATIARIEQSVTTAALSEYSVLKVYPAGSLVVAMYGATMGRIGLLGMAACVNQACCVFAEPTRLDARFAMYALLAQRDELCGDAAGGGQPNLNAELLKNARIPCPPPDEQHRTVRVLDRETAKIDDLIGKKQRLLELLEEKRAAIITRAVTKGLARSVSMKDSAVAWLAFIPQHWGIKTLNRFCYLQRGHDLPESHREDGLVPIISSSGATAYHSRPAARGPGIVTGRYGTIGKVFLVEGDYWPLNTTLYSINLYGNDPAYVKYMLEQLPLDSDCEKSAVPGVNRNYLHKLNVACPPIPEQITIARWCTEEEQKIKRAQTTIDHAISLLREYRSALITAAVTGQLEMRKHEEQMEVLVS
jgi:type I restriction enzyme, S subunit